ncbi:MAG: hypothetical protein MJ245_01760 [Clostridia bacterium]|nr:hypothetical protein [Clostridia bacterium]
MWIDAVRGVPVWIGAIMGLVIYILTIFLFFILCAICFKISDKIHPPKPWEEGYKSKFDE